MKPESPSANLSNEALDSVCECLADRRRRRIVTYLDEATTPIARESLFRRVEEREGASAADSMPDERVERTYLSMYHVHLPKLNDAGIVATDDESETVERGDRFEVALRLIPE